MAETMVRAIRVQYGVEVRRKGSNKAPRLCPERFDLEQGAQALVELLHKQRPDLEAWTVRLSRTVREPKSANPLLGL